MSGWARIISNGAFIVALSVGCASCGTDPDCVQLGSNPIDNLQLVSAHATKLGLSTPTREAAFIVGWAKGMSDIDGGKPVLVCLRPTQGEQTEFRVIASNGNVLEEWGSAAALMSRQP